MQSYDLIGDIHGQATELKALLEKIGYEIDSDGIYSHTSRKVIFLGDFIDRGDQQKQVINIVRPMIESGHALSVMGNHEFNAIAYSLKDEETGEYLREHNDHNSGQHAAFLSEYKDDEPAYEEVINWFMTLPLWLDLGELRIIHACWDNQWIEKLKPVLNDNNTLDENIVKMASNKNNWAFEAIETLLKGKEIPLKNGVSFTDKDGHTRHNIRVRWWDQSATTYKTAFMGPENAVTHIPDDEINGDHLVEYSHDDVPVFLGHYWMTGKPEPLAKNIACTDYSIAYQGGKLVVYRWDGEQTLSSNNFVWVDRIN